MSLLLKVADKMNSNNFSDLKRKEQSNTQKQNVFLRTYPKQLTKTKNRSEFLKTYTSKV